MIMTVINTNVKSLVAQDSLRANNNKLSQAMERLSTGSKVNSAKDDAAGLAIGTRMTAQVRGLSMAIKNANDGINLVQTSEGAMNEVTDMLQRMRELAVVAGNSTNTDTDRAAMNDEIAQLKAEIDRVAGTTRFNGMNILDGSFKGKLQIGNNADQTMDLAIGSIATKAMGETTSGLAKGATKASLSLGGVATSAAAYSGVSFNANVNGVAKTVTLPTAVPANPVATKNIVANDKSVSLTSEIVGKFAERVISVSTNGTLKISVNDGDVGTQLIDVKTAAENLGYDTTKLNGDKFVKSLQAAIDSSVYFSGDNKVTVGLDANNNVTFNVAGGAKKIAVSEGNNGLLAAISGAATTLVATGTTLSAKTINAAHTAAQSDAAEVFGMMRYGIANGTNDSLTVKVGSGQAATVDLVTSDSYFDNMSDLATFVQSKLNASGNFSGDNAVNVSAENDGNGNWGLTFTNPAGKQVELSGNFMTAMSGLTDTVNESATSPVAGTSAFLPTGTTSIKLNTTKIYGEVAPKTIDLSSVMASDGTSAIATGMQKLKLNVNGGGDVVIDMSTILTDMAAADVNFSKAAVTKDQFVYALQKAIDNTGLFTGSNKVTVGVSDKGNITLNVAGGVGSIVVKEDSGTTAATKYDGLVKTLTGTNQGVIGNAIDTVSSGGFLELGAAYNDNIASTATKPAGQMVLTTATADTVTNSVASWVLKDSLGNTTSFTSAASGGTTMALFVTSLQDALKGLAATGGTATAFSDSGNVAGLYDISATAGNTGVLIKRKDGVDFTLQLGSADAQVALTPDGTSATALVKGNAPVSSSQLVNTFTTGPTVLGSGSGGTPEIVKYLMSGATRAGDTIQFGGFTYTLSTDEAGAHSDGLKNKIIDNFVSAFNNTSGNKNYVASRGIDSQLVMTATNPGNDTSDPAVTFGVVGAGSGIAGAPTRTDGTAPTYNLENTLTLQVGGTDPIDVKISSADYEYSTLDQLKSKVQSAIDSTVGLQGENRVIVSVATDPLTGKSGLSFAQASNQSLGVSGSFITNELKSKAAVQNYAVSGGVDLSANNQLSVTVSDVNSGQTRTENIILGSSSKNVSMSDYAALVQAGINKAFSSSGTTVNVAVNNGQFSLGLDQPGSKTITVSGASINAALGVNQVSASGVGVNALSTMSDVAKAIQEDLGDVATVAYDAASGKMTFTALNGDAGSNNSISLSGAGLAAIQFGGTLSAKGQAGDATASKLDNVNVLSTDAATAALGSIDNAIEYVSKQRSLLGAIQNRLEHTVNNLTNIVANTEASRSAIMDADYSKETTALAKSQILTQAATAMLAQANQSQQTVLSLLK
jgi:flagellin